MEEDHENLAPGTLYCILCLETELEPSPAVTIVDGNAACTSHYSFFSLGDDCIQYFKEQYFKKLREKNIKEDG